MKRTLRLECAAALLTASVCGGAVHAAMDPGGVIENYADIAHAIALPIIPTTLTTTT